MRNCDVWLFHQEWPCWLAFSVCWFYLQCLQHLFSRQPENVLTCMSLKKKSPGSCIGSHELAVSLETDNYSKAGKNLDANSYSGMVGVGLRLDFVSIQTKNQCGGGQNK